MAQRRTLTDIADVRLNWPKGQFSEKMVQIDKFPEYAKYIYMIHRI